jgi:ribose-phosphate pyrophosphokinase
MELSLFAGSANPSLAESVAERLGVALRSRALTRFPDTELRVELKATVRGHDVYLIQPTGPPVDEHLMDLMLMADASRRAGVHRLTAVIPYLGYARQDRRVTGRESVGARLIADLIAASGIERVVAVDLHTAALEAVFSIPLEHLSAVPLLAEALRPHLPRQAVVVAPDLGAVKLARRYARILDLPMAIVHKTRISAERVEASGVVGDVQGRSPVIVDDMISTGGTIEAAHQALFAAGCAGDALVASTHGLFTGPALERLTALGIKALFTTDSLVVRAMPLAIHPVGLAPMLAEAIKRLHEGRSLSDLLARE